MGCCKHKILLRSDFFSSKVKQQSDAIATNITSSHWLLEVGHNAPLLKLRYEQWLL